MTATRKTFRPIRLLGSGGTAHVWLAVDSRTGRQVALKTLRAELIDDPVAQARFRFEIEVARKLSHPNIPAFVDAGEDHQGPFLVAEFVDGENLETILRAERRLEEAQAVAMVRDVARALEAAHAAGLMHRDVKPANIIISRATGKAYLTDFGIASSLGVPDDLTRPDGVVGTLPYLAPERALGAIGDESSDIYGLGMVLYRLLTGRGALSGKTPAELVLAQQTQGVAPPGRFVEVSPAIEHVIMRSIEPAPADRYRSAAHLIAALEHATAVCPTALRPGTGEQRRRFGGRKRSSARSSVATRLAPAAAAAAAIFLTGLPFGF